MKIKLRLVAELGGPLVLVAAVALVGNMMSIAQQTNIINILVTATIVIGLYVFIGNSGVMSFGQVSFVAVAAFAAGILTSPVAIRSTTMPQLFHFLAVTKISNLDSLLLGAVLGALFALLAGLVLMRLSGLAAGIATFAVLEITYDVITYWNKIGPGARTLALVPVSTTLMVSAVGCGIAVLIAFLYQHTRSCRLLRASREDISAARGIGVSVFRQRLIAFTLSGAISGFGGALFVHELGSIQSSQVYIDLTFTTLAMLVVGGSGSLWGATVGGIGFGIIDVFLRNMENGIALGSLHLSIPNGTSTIILGAFMVAVLILLPRGVTGSRECFERFFMKKTSKIIHIDSTEQPSNNKPSDRKRVKLVDKELQRQPETLS